MDNEFYVGWEDRMPRRLAQRLRLGVLSTITAAVFLSLSLAAAQRGIARSQFEWGQTKQFVGILKARPVPHLLVQRPATAVSPTNYSNYYLVKPFKFGFDPATLQDFDDATVSLKGTLIYRGNQTMIEVVENSITALREGDPGLANHGTPPLVNLGHRTLAGEIVDSKCYFGVMNPGRLTPHRACAIRCLSGGIPPVLLVHLPDRKTQTYLLISRDGRPLNDAILDRVAQPVEVHGETLQQGELLILRADPADIRLLPN